MDDDNGPLIESVFFERIEHALHAVVELPRAAIVKRRNLRGIGWAELLPLILQVRAANEGIDIEIDRMTMLAAIAGVGKHLMIRRLRAIRKVIARIKSKREKRLFFLSHRGEMFFQSVGDDIRRDELSERFDLREKLIAEGVVKIKWHDEMSHDDSLAHVNLKIVEGRDRDGFMA